MRHKLHPGQNSKPSRERGHVIVTVKLHDEIHNDRGQCCIQFVELAAAEADADPVQASFVRRTLASLGAALKNLVVKDQSPTRSTTVSYRESVLLRLLKKTLDPPGARAVLIGTVLPDRSCYVSTLQTMNFCSRLLSRSSLPGTSLSRKGGDRWRYEKTHRSSPFPSAISSTSGISDNKTPGSGEGVMTQLLESEGRRERADLLKNVLSDPRQVCFVFLALKML